MHPVRLRSPRRRAPGAMTPEWDVRLYCLPHAGAGGTAFRKLAWALQSRISVHGVTYPGREARIDEPLAFTVQHLAADLINGDVIQTDRPYALFGHSLGALVAYETAVRLCQLRVPAPVALFVSAERAPHLPYRGTRTTEMSDAELIERLVRMGGTSADVVRHERLMDLLLPIIRADFALDEQYVHKNACGSLGVPIVAIGGRTDEFALPEELGAWARHTAGQFHVRLLDGGHFYWFDQYEQLATLIADELATACEKDR
jgi:medium-chain acyl-[acyl-carrier-protein] hydrolase